jgi:hypothetical protein
MVSISQSGRCGIRTKSKPAAPRTYGIGRSRSHATRPAFCEPVRVLRLRFWPVRSWSICPKIPLKGFERSNSHIRSVPHRGDPTTDPADGLSAVHWVLNRSVEAMPDQSAGPSVVAEAEDPCPSLEDLRALRSRPHASWHSRPLVRGVQGRRSGGCPLALREPWHRASFARGGVLVGTGRIETSGDQRQPTCRHRGSIGKGNSTVAS